MSNLDYEINSSAPPPNCVLTSTMCIPQREMDLKGSPQTKQPGPGI